MNKPDDFDMTIVNRFFTSDYHDRGMVKWQGFYLSDHTSALNKQHAQMQLTYEERPQQSLQTISTILAASYTQHTLVAIQLQSVDPNGNLFPDQVGTVSGYNDTDIIINETHFIALASIRNVRPLTN
ncbi:hypothetical protein C5Z25_00495 [Lactobacillus sp. CBA3605]|uniref:hypothetical protein n=1 Tax=Lactobacillus sp. CBA3605 TaxID=2099788 RepID=UPI000CFC7A08|nr:hypothetical protein [Lactobacillus sp. CBA3605]AVK60346.1 hypothetical protein C5Z25_00495 [Lactobacillus sp. CBA3605]